VCRQLADRLLVADVRAKGPSGALEQRIILTSPGDFDSDTTDRLGISSIDNRTLVPAKRSDSVARAQEGKIAFRNIIKQGGKFGFHSPLRGGFDFLVITGLEGPAAENDSRPPIKINDAKLGLLNPDSAQLSFVESSAAQHGGIFVVGGNILGPDPQHQERLHVRTLRD
jgi:hypothetical protein